MTAHNVLSNAELHEPKNMQGLTAGAADIGKVPVSKGDGTTESRKLSRLELSDIFEHYGTLAVSDNSTVIAMTIAADTTLGTNTDYIKITGIYDATPHGVLNGITQGSDNLTITQDGIYEIHIWADTSSSINSTTIAFKFAVNGTIGLVRRPKNFMRNAGEFHNLSAHGFVALSVGDVLDLRLASDKTANIIIEDMVLSLNLLRAT